MRPSGLQHFVQRISRSLLLIVLLGLFLLGAVSVRAQQLSQLKV